MLALMTTSEGIPLGHTLIAAIEELQTHYCLKNTYLVADRGMFNSDNLSSLEDLGVKYIVAAKTLKKGFKEEILDDFCRLKKQKKDFLLKEYELWQIEDAFRVNKHDLKMRPIYHWTENRTRAHISICYMAYCLSVYMKKKLVDKGVKLSFRKIKEELNDYQESILEDSKTGQRFALPSATTQIQKNIYTRHLIYE